MTFSKLKETMATKLKDHLKQMVHPYVFVLKEGAEIYDDYLDYSLLMLQMTCIEVMPSPFKKRKETPFLHTTYFHPKI